jgi:hypothetical protein
MKTIIERLEQDFLLGFVKYNDTYELYLMPLGYWILNYKKYDPTYNPDDWEFIYRDSILNVTEHEIEAFMNAINQDRISLSELNKVLSANPERKFDYIYILIDFDQQLFVSAFPEVEIENYLPDNTWNGLFDSPISFLPEEITRQLNV